MVALAMFEVGTTVAFKLTQRQALAAPAHPLDPATLHTQLQRSRDEMALP
jgi:hypothetical protein